jgi:hypothetical protein
MHYSIEFKSRPRTAGVGQSFRRKCEAKSVGDSFVGDFITFDRYEKMLASKERVVAAKTGFQL